jgi:hypothetical protein
MRTPATLPISTDQIKAIKTAQRAHGLSDETYRAMLWSLFRVTSCTQLTQAQARAVLDRLNGRGTSPTRPARPVVGRPHTWPFDPAQGRRRPGKPRWPSGPDPEITPRQQAYLDGLFARLGWDAIRRGAFCQKLIGTPWPQTNRQVTALLQVLRPLVTRYPQGYERAGTKEGTTS